MQERKPRRGDVLELVLERLGPSGEAVGALGAIAVRVADGVPGASVRAQVLRRRRDTVDARLLDVLDPGPHQVAPRCAHFASCGGCARQDLAYAAQLAELGRLLGEQVAPLVDERTQVEPVVGADEPWHYRNKMDFTFGSRRWVEAHEPADAERGFALGLHARGRWDRVLDVEGCTIAFREASPIVQSARRLARARGLEPWDVREHRGLLRHLVLRKGVRTGELLAFLVTSPGAREAVDAYARELVSAHPEITTLVHGERAARASVAQAEEERVLHGSGAIHEELCGLRFTISPQSFFQTNTPQAERLARAVREAAGAGAGTVVWDLYCGGGLFSLVLASAPAPPRAVVGFELCEAAVLDARANARANGVLGARFVAGDLARALAHGALPEGLERPDVCVVDPPRAGAHPSVLAALVALAPRRIVWVSCNPRGAVRELAQLRAQGWRLLQAQPFDLFPHTPHLECVFTLERAP